LFVSPHVLRKRKTMSDSENELKDSSDDGESIEILNRYVTVHKPNIASIVARNKRKRGQKAEAINNKKSKLNKKTDHTAIHKLVKKGTYIRRMD
jgi:hypothetical protein